MERNVCIAVLVIAGLSSGCASITGTSNQSVSVQTREQGGKELHGAACELTNNKGKWFVTSPGSVMIHRSNDDMQVLCNKEGLEPGRAAVVSETKGSMFGNIIFGGGIGAVIDHNNGSAYEYPGLIQVLMGAFSKIEPPKPQDTASATPSIQGAAQVATTATAPAQALTPKSPGPVALAKVEVTKEQRLTEAKALFDKGLISKETYSEQQRAILANN